MIRIFFKTKLLKLLTIGLVVTGVFLYSLHNLNSKLEEAAATSLSQPHGVRSEYDARFSSVQNTTQNIKLPSGYNPPCSIKNAFSTSAINRASSKSCKIELAETACKSVDASDGIGTLYPASLPNFCPAANSSNSKLVGPYSGK